MPPPEPRPEPSRAPRSGPEDPRGRAPSGERTTSDRAAPGRQRPRPTSGLAPSPAPLMPVADTDELAARGRSRDERAGRRQHHRSPLVPATAPAEDLVYLSGRVPRPLRDELHIRAIKEGRPVVELLRDAIRGYLDRPLPEPPP